MQGFEGGSASLPLSGLLRRVEGQKRPWWIVASLHTVAILVICRFSLTYINSWETVFSLFPLVSLQTLRSVLARLTRKTSMTRWSLIAKRRGSVTRNNTGNRLAMFPIHCDIYDTFSVYIQLHFIRLNHTPYKRLYTFGPLGPYGPSSPVIPGYPWSPGEPMAPLWPCSPLGPCVEGEGTI